MKLFNNDIVPKGGVVGGVRYDVLPRSSQVRVGKPDGKEEIVEDVPDEVGDALLKMKRAIIVIEQTPAPQQVIVPEPVEEAPAPEPEQAEEPEPVEEAGEPEKKRGRPKKR